MENLYYGHTVGKFHLCSLGNLSLFSLRRLSPTDCEFPFMDPSDMPQNDIIIKKEQQRHDHSTSGRGNDGDCRCDRVLTSFLRVDIDQGRDQAS